MGCQLTSLNLTRSPNWPPLAQKYHWRKAPTDLFWDENVSDAGPQLNFLWSKKYHWCKAPTDLLWSKHSLTTDHLDVLIWRFYETYYWKSCEADISKLGGAQWMASLQLAGPGWTRRGEWHRMFNWFAFIMSTKIYLLHFWYHHIFLNQYLYYAGRGTYWVYQLIEIICCSKGNLNLHCIMWS